MPKIIGYRFILTLSEFPIHTLNWQCTTRKLQVQKSSDRRWKDRSVAPSFAIETLNFWGLYLTPNRGATPP